MIRFEKTDKRKYNLFKDDVELCKLDLMFSPATNKFEKITEFVEDCSLVLGEPFDNWFSTLATTYITSNYDSSIIRNCINQLTTFVDAYIESKEISFDDYIDLKKVSSNSIFFDAEEIKRIVQVSNYLKIYYVFSQDNVMKLPHKFHKEIYNILIEKIKNEILYKLFKIVSSKTFKYNHTDNYMWEFIRLTRCKTPDTHIHSIFNFIITNIIVTCETIQNPIPYLISVIDESIKWIIRGVYPDVIIYTDTINTEDINYHSKDNLKTYSFNDTIGRLIIAAQKYISEEGIEDIAFHDSVKNLQETSIISSYFTYLILSSVLNIPYKNFVPIPPEHSYLLNILVHNTLPQELRDEYPTLFKFLMIANKNKCIQKTSYKLRNLNSVLDNFTTIKGFRDVSFAESIYSSVIGKMIRNEYVHIKTGEQIAMPLATMEREICQFYNKHLSNSFEELYRKMENELEKLLV